MIAFCLFTTFQDMYFSFNLISTFSSVSVNFSVLKGFALPSLIWNLVLNNICSNHSFRLLYVLLNLWHIFTHKHTYVVWTVLISKSIHLWSYKRLSGKEPICQCRRHRKCGFDLWVRKIPWRRKWQSTPVFLPRKSIYRQLSDKKQQNYWCWILDQTYGRHYRCENEYNTLAAFKKNSGNIENNGKIWVRFH